VKCPRLGQKSAAFRRAGTRLTATINLIYLFIEYTSVTRHIHTMARVSPPTARSGLASRAAALMVVAGVLLMAQAAVAFQKPAPAKVGPRVPRPDVGATIVGGSTAPMGRCGDWVGCLGCR
jgi:hypothetical protein